eukprot:SAG11_NODE_1248_length_5396_cov_2.091372_4_plen_174_part_00
MCRGAPCVECLARVLGVLAQRLQLVARVVKRERACDWRLTVSQHLFFQEEELKFLRVGGGVMSSCARAMNFASSSGECTRGVANEDAAGKQTKTNLLLRLDLQSLLLVKRVLVHYERRRHTDIYRVALCCTAKSLTLSNLLHLDLALELLSLELSFEVCDLLVQLNRLAFLVL